MRRYARAILPKLSRGFGWILSFQLFVGAGRALGGADGAPGAFTSSVLFGFIFAGAYGLWVLWRSRGTRREEWCWVGIALFCYVGLAAIGLGLFVLSGFALLFGCVILGLGIFLATRVVVDELPIEKRIKQIEATDDEEANQW